MGPPIKNLDSDSWWRVCAERAKYLASTEGEHVTVVVPSKNDANYDDLMFEGCDLIEIPFQKKMAGMALSIDFFEMLSRSSNGSPYDIVLVNPPFLKNTLDVFFRYISYQGGFIPWVSRLYTSPVVVAMPLYSYKEPPVWVDMCRELIPLSDGHAIFNSDLQRAEFLEGARRHLKSSSILKLSDSLKTVWLSIQTEKLKMSSLPNKDENLVFRYSGRLDAQKMAYEGIKVADKIFRTGRDVAIKVNLTGLAGGSNEDNKNVSKSSLYSKMVSEMPYIDVEMNLSVDEYFDRLSKSHLFICGSKVESFGLVNFEMLYSGMVGVFVHRPWMDYMIPKEYPYIVSSFKEAEKVLMWIVDNFEKARKEISFMRKIIDDRYSKKAVVDGLMCCKDMVLKNVSILRNDLLKSPLYEILGDEFKDKDYASINDVVDVILNKTPISKGTMKLCMRGIRNIMSYHGFVDNCEGTDVEFVKKDV